MTISANYRYGLGCAAGTDPSGGPIERLAFTLGVLDGVEGRWHHALTDDERDAMSRTVGAVTRLLSIEVGVFPPDRTQGV